MALVNCSECGKQISDKAATCPQCGAPVITPPASATPVDRARATLFENPRTGQTTSISNAAVYTLFFGCFYLALKGVWTHAIIGAVLAVLTYGISWLVYPAFAQGIVRRHLLETGWIPKAVEVADRPHDNG